MKRRDKILLKAMNAIYLIAHLYVFVVCLLFMYIELPNIIEALLVFGAAFCGFARGITPTLNGLTITYGN